MKTLAELAVGLTSQVIAVGGGGSFRRRLLELGLVPGAAITRLGQAPLGDPLTYRIRGATVCLRRADAAAISVVALVPAT